MLSKTLRFLAFNNSGVALATTDLTLGIEWWRIAPAGTLEYSGAQLNLQNANVIADGAFGTVGATISNAGSLWYGGKVEIQVFLAGSPTLDVQVYMPRSTDGGAIFDDDANAYFIAAVPAGGGAGTKIKTVSFD